MDSFQIVPHSSPFSSFTGLTGAFATGGAAFFTGAGAFFCAGAASTLGAGVGSPLSKSPNLLIFL